MSHDVDARGQCVRPPVFDRRCGTARQVSLSAERTLLRMLCMSPSEAPSLFSLSANDRTRGVLLLVLSSILWGCWSIVFRTAEQLSTTPLPAARQTAVVMAVQLLLLLPLARRATTTATTTTTTAKNDRFWFVALGVCDALNAMSFFASMQRTSVAIAVLCHYAAPLIVAALAPVVLHEPRRAGTWAALAVAVAGVVVVLSPWANVSAGDVEGAGLALVSAGFYAASVFIGKHLLARRSTIEVAAYPKWSAVAVTAVGAVVFTGGVHVELGPLALLVGGSVVCGALALLTFYRGLSLLPASQASVLTLVEPLTAVIVGVVVWHEPLTAGIVVGGLLVAFAVVRVTRA